MHLTFQTMMHQAAGNPEKPPSLSKLQNVINVDPKGDVILAVTFITGRETLKVARKAAARSSTQTQAATSYSPLKPRTRVAYRVQTSVLRKCSQYFSNLLGNSSFNEARLVSSKLAALSVSNIKPSQADAGDLPWVEIEDDDEATRSAGREAVFGDMLRMLHGADIVTKPVIMSFVTTLAVLADRFACTLAVSKCLGTKVKFRWPMTRTAKEDERSGLSEAAESILRQKILVAWLLDQPVKMGSATRELILLGSRRWVLWDGDGEHTTATWWDLPDGLEGE